MGYNVLSGVVMALMVFSSLEAGKTKLQSQDPSESKVKTSTLERSLSADRNSKAWVEKRELLRKQSHPNLKQSQSDYHELVKNGEEAKEQAKVVSSHLDFVSNKEGQRPSELECLNAIKKIITLQEKGNVVSFNILKPVLSIIYYKAIHSLQSRKLEEAALWLDAIRHVEDKDDKAKHSNKAKALFALLNLHFGKVNAASPVLMKLTRNSEESRYLLNLANVYELQRNYSDAQRTYQLALNSGNKQCIVPALSKLLLLTCSDKNNLDSLGPLLKQGEETFISENKGCSDIDLAYLAFYLGKTQETEKLCDQAYKRTSSPRYEPRSLEDLSEDILISTLYWSMEHLEKENRTKAAERIGEVAKSLRQKPFDSDRVHLILFYLEPRNALEFMNLDAQEVVLDKLSQEVLAQRKLITEPLKQTSHLESI